MSLLSFFLLKLEAGFSNDDDDDDDHDHDDHDDDAADDDDDDDAADDNDKPHSSRTSGFSFSILILIDSQTIEQQRKKRIPK